MLKVYARSPDEELQVARELRPLTGSGAGAPLPPPAPDVRRLVARVCN